MKSFSLFAERETNEFPIPGDCISNGPSASCPSSPRIDYLLITFFIFAYRQLSEVTQTGTTRFATLANVWGDECSA